MQELYRRVIKICFDRKQVGEKDKLPCRASENPYIFEEEQELNCFLGNLLKEEQHIAGVKSALFSVYLDVDNSEIGIYAFEADNPKIASEILVYLSSIEDYQDRSNFYQDKDIVVWLWKDHGKTESFYNLEEVLLKELK